jgi:hypothetical protein
MTTIKLHRNPKCNEKAAGAHSTGHYAQNCTSHAIAKETAEDTLLKQSLI